MAPSGWRVYQHGDTGTILAWYVPGDLLQEGSAGWRIMVAPHPRAAPPPGLGGRVVLVGYSAGCQGVRAALGIDPAAVVTIDGTHDTLPPSRLAGWERLAARARAGDALWIATCLAAHRYVERGRGAYAATVRVLEAATGAALSSPPTRNPSGVGKGGKVIGPAAECRVHRAIDDGGLHIRSYHSADTDHNEHAAQLTRVLPDLWRELWIPWAADQVPPTERAAPSVRALPARPLGERIADTAAGYLGTRELPGLANNPQIGAMLYPCRRGGSAAAGILDATGDRIGLVDDSFAWCAAFRSFVLFLAGDWTEDTDRAACPHGYRISVRELCEDARRRGTLRAPADPRVGDAAIWTRAGGDPLRGGHGHVATVVEVRGARFRAIGGNEGDEVRESWHEVGEPGLVALIG